MTEKISVSSILNSSTDPSENIKAPPMTSKAFNDTSPRIPSISELFGAASSPRGPPGDIRQTEQIQKRYSPRPNDANSHTEGQHQLHESPRMIPKHYARPISYPNYPQKQSDASEIARKHYEQAGAWSPSTHHSTASTANRTTLPVSKPTSQSLPYRKTRENLPRAATNALKSWLISHASNPYPTDAEKRLMCEEFNLTIVQVNNWFINGRRRYLKRNVEEQSGIQKITFSPNSSLNSSLNDSIGRSAFAALRLNESQNNESKILETAAKLVQMGAASSVMNDEAKYASEPSSLDASWNSSHGLKLENSS